MTKYNFFLFYNYLKMHARIILDATQSQVLSTPFLIPCGFRLRTLMPLEDPQEVGPALSPQGVGLVTFFHPLPVNTAEELFIKYLLKRSWFKKSLKRSE